MNKEEKTNFRYVANEILENYPYDGNVRDAINTLAEEFSVPLVEGWAYADNVHRAVTDKEIALYSHPSGTPPGSNSKETVIRLYPQMKQKFGDLGWVGKKFKITVEEIFD